MPHASVNGARLWYEVRGRGEPVLLHHGYTASRVNWMPVAERLQDEFQVILMECRGTGESEHTADGYDLAQYAADVLGMLDHLGLERVAFAGHSMGGGIGYLLGLEHAERLTKLVLMAPIPANGTGNPDPALEAARAKERREGNREALFARYVAERFREDVETDAWFRSRVDHVLGVSDGHYEQSAESMRRLRLKDRLPELTTPTLMIAGAADVLLRPNLSDFRRLPDATLEVLSRAGHEVAVHEPERVAHAIREFLVFGPAPRAWPPRPPAAEGTSR
ncbi:MAG: alpha/beta fold hydrolase [Myxococcota bacterium]